MKKMDQMMTGLYAFAISSWTEFRNNERGDTNFISILIIIAIVLVLAGAFMTFGKSIMDTVQLKVEEFIANLTPNTSIS